MKERCLIGWSLLLLAASVDCLGEQKRPSAIRLNAGDFVQQDSELFVDVRKDGQGIDLTGYVLEMTFRGAEGKDVQLFFKDCRWKNVYAWPKKVSGQTTIRFDPVKDKRNVNEFAEFTCINAVGLKVYNDSANGISVISAQLVQ